MLMKFLRPNKKGFSEEQKRNRTRRNPAQGPEKSGVGWGKEGSFPFQSIQNIPLGSIMYTARQLAR